jgi:hypothetical protein
MGFTYVVDFSFKLSQIAEYKLGFTYVVDFSFKWSQIVSNCVHKIERNIQATRSLSSLFSWGTTNRVALSIALSLQNNIHYACSLSLLGFAYMVNFDLPSICLHAWKQQLAHLQLLI